MKKTTDWRTDGSSVSVVLRYFTFRDMYSLTELIESHDIDFKLRRGYPTVLVLEDNKLVGFCSGIIVDGAFNVLQLFVVPQCRRRGYGLRLLQEIRNFCDKRKCDTIVVSVCEYAVTSQLFLRTAGFIGTGVNNTIVFTMGSAHGESTSVGYSQSRLG